MFCLFFRGAVPVWAERVQGFEFKSRASKASRATFTVDNSDYAFLDASQFEAGSCEITFGEQDAMSPHLILDMSRVTGSRELKIEATTTEMRLMATPKTRLWEGGTLRDILDQVAQDWGMGVSAQTDPCLVDILIGAIPQAGETDAQFLRRLALIYGYSWWIDGNTLNFTSYERTPVKALAWGELLADPEFEFVARRMRAASKVKGQTQGPGGMADVQDGLAADADVLGGGPPGQKGSMQYVGKYYITGATQQEHYIPVLIVDRVGETTEAGQALHDEWAYGPKKAIDEFIAHSTEAARKELTGKVAKLTVKILGDATIRAGQSIELTGAPSILDGQWYMDEVTHSWTGPFITTISLKKHGAKNAMKAMANARMMVDACEKAAKDAQPLVKEIIPFYPGWSSVRTPRMAGS